MSATEAVRYWWLYLVTGGAWCLFAIVVFRFDWTTVHAISILFGIFMIAAAVNEAIAIGATEGTGWKVLRGFLALAFVVLGIIAFVHPGNTFKALAAVLSFYFILKGVFGLILTLAVRGDHWWIGLLVAIADLVIGFWAAGDFGHKTILLVVWVGVAALTRGIMQIVMAFQLRNTGTVTA